MRPPPAARQAAPPSPRPLALVLHGHFYQPPRENPWTGKVDREPNAAPDHDWNARITRECYAPLADAPLADQLGAPTVSAYEWLSFDVGPTLLDWLEREAPAVYQAMIAADCKSAERLGGHGNAIAAPYHHVILPLLSRRDKASEIRWGVADFRRRFGREPVGLWMPETAVDMETLGVIAEAGLQFTIVGQHQLATPPETGRAAAVDVGGGKTLAVFAFDETLSHGVAFGPLVDDAAAWERAMLARRQAGVTSIAVDGETWGHHHKGGVAELGDLISRLRSWSAARLENYASALAAQGAGGASALVEPSSWSCAHGVGRWTRNCGCRIDGHTQQEWRAPLRGAIDWLTAEVHAIAERRGGDEDLERRVLTAHTSCGWFFDDFGKLEGRQVLRAAADTIAHTGEDAARLEAGLVERLAPARSNDASVGTAKDFYLKAIVPERPR